MNEVTRILSTIEGGDEQAAERLVPLVYDEQRRLAARRLAREKPGQTLLATALVHEAYPCLVRANGDRGWEGRGYFFAAAVEAMRQFLIDRVRDRGSGVKAGRKRFDFPQMEAVTAALTALPALDELCFFPTFGYQSASRID